MLIEQLFCIGITLDDPISFVRDEEVFISKYINNNYMFKCYLNTLIIKLIKIEKYTEPELLVNDIDGHAHVSVKFRAQCVVFGSDECVVACKIENIAANNIICLHEHASVVIKADKRLEFLQKDMYLPIVVARAVYTPNAPRVSLMAKPFTIRTVDLKYKVGGNHDSSASWFISTPHIISEIKKLRTEIDTLPKQNVLFFMDLISTKQLTDSASLIDILDWSEITSNDNKLIIYPRHGDLATKAEPGCAGSLPLPWHGA